MKRLFLLSTLLLLVCPLHAETFSFAVIGDVPYSEFERRHVPHMLDEIGRTEAAFIVHSGDIKNGHSECSDAVFQDRLALFETAPLPFVLVPGDNEWTDCARGSNGRYVPLERLQALRDLFFAGDYTLGRHKLRLERQSSMRGFSEFRENVRWAHGRVLFLSLNMPGDTNNWGRRAAPNREFPRRNKANLAWLHEGFAKARAEKFAGVVIIIQANPRFEAAESSRRQRGYRDFLWMLRRETLAFGGQVLLIHGDTHSHRIDKPLIDPKTGLTVENFTRLETYGSPFMGWVTVMADSDHLQVFHFKSHPYAPPLGPLN